jgi:hypothetical protein
MLTEETVKQILFYCQNRDPKGLYYSDDEEPLDVLEFAGKLEEYLTERIRLKEHARCVDIVKSMNKDVARVLEDNKSA